MKKHQATTNWGMVYKITDKYYPKETKEDRNDRRLQKTMEIWQLNTIWDPGVGSVIEKRH